MRNRALTPLLAVLLAGCYASSPFELTDAVVPDHAGDRADAADVPAEDAARPDVPEDGTTDDATCPTGWRLCPDGCRDLRSDPENCGTCGAMCAPGTLCIDGVCAGCTCPPGTTCCGPLCINLATDPNNCGSCGNACPAGDSCVAGECRGDPCSDVICPPGYGCCDGACVDLTGDPANCGWCHHTCPWGATDPDESMRGCLEPSRGVYQHCCGGACVSPSDAACTACDVSCGTGHCSGLWDATTGVCEFACLSLGGAVGAACTGADDCAELPGVVPICLTTFMRVSLPGGYCTVRDCSTGEECGPGGECVSLMRNSYCLRTCTGDAECRTDEGYICQELPYIGGGPYCLPAGIGG